jgi:hypothetical protein
MKLMKLILLLPSLLLALLAGFPAHAALTTNWPFITASQYSFSDTNKIEVADGVAKLIRQKKPLNYASISDYTTNDTSVANLALGPNVSVGLVSNGAGASVIGRYLSPVIDGDALGGINIWNGLRIRTSNRVLSANALWETSSFSPGLLALYHFNGDGADTVSGIPGILVNSPQFTSSAALGSQALSLRGGVGGSGFTVANTNILEGASAFTLSLWVKLLGYDEYGGLMDSRSSQIFGLWQRNSGKVELWLGNLVPICTSTSSLAMGQWYYVVGTINGGVCRLYLNGVLESSSNSAVTTVTQTAPLDIGWDRSQNSRYSRGVFDEVAVYNRELSAAEINALYNHRTSIGLRLRSGSTPQLAGSFVGPDGTSSSYFVGDSQPLNSAGLFDVSHRYLQFEALFSSDGIRSPYLDAVQILGSAGVVGEDVLGDFCQGSYVQNTTNVPVRLDTPFVTLAKGSQGVFTNGVFVSRVFDAGFPVSWTSLSWDRGAELSQTLYGIVGLWHMNGDWSEMISARSIISGNGTAFTTFSKLGNSSAVFNGTNSFVCFGDFQTNLLSAELWLNTDVGTAGILEFGASRTWLAVSNQVITIDGWSNAPPLVYVNGGQARQLLPGWNHVAVVFPTNIVSDNLTLGLARGSYFSGRLDELAVYNRALTAAEISEHFVGGRREAAGRVRLQVRADNVNPILGAFSSDYTDPSPLSSKVGRYFQYSVILDGDGTASPALSSVTVANSSGSVTDRTKNDFLAGTLNGTTVRMHGDEISLRPLVSSGALNLMSADTTSLLG